MTINDIDQNVTTRRERDAQLRLLKTAIMNQLAPNVTLVRLTDPTLPVDLETWPVSSVSGRA